MRQGNYQKAHCGWIELLVNRCAPAIQLAITVGCASVTSERLPAARLAEIQQVLQEAQGTAAGFEDKEFRSMALRVIALWQVEASDVRKALATAATIEDASNKAHALWMVAAAQLTAKDSEGATKTYDEALEAAAAIPITKEFLGEIAKPITVALIAADRAEAGDVQGTLAWAAARTGDPVAKVSALVGVVAGVLKPTGRLSESVQKRLLPRWSRSLL